MSAENDPILIAFREYFTSVECRDGKAYVTSPKTPPDPRNKTANKSREVLRRRV